jgi:hypothetical protein
LQSTLNFPPSKSKAQLLGYTLLERFFRGWVFLAISILLIVWALPHTIAARNIALFTGAGAGIGWMLLTRPALSWKAYWPSICLLLVPLWVLFHWYYISTLKDLQWQELTSTWLRTSAGVVLGSVAGIMLSKHPRQIIWVILAIALLPTLTFGLYLYQVYLQHNWVLPSGMFYAPFKGKFSGVYFMLCQVLVGFGLIYFAIDSKSRKVRVWILLMGVALVLMGVVDFIAARALNGILVSGLGAALCLLAVIYRSLAGLTDQNRSAMHKAKALSLGLLSIAIVTAALFAFWTYDQRYEGKLTNLIGDIQIATQIDKNQTWIRDGRPIPEPVDSKGRPINGSTYERVSWFIKGTQLVQANPLGNGISHMAFGHYMRSEYPKSLALMTHSAWIDYTLGLGLPGLFLVWAAIIGVIARSFSWRQMSALKDPGALVPDPTGGQLLADIALWLILGMFFFWIVGEVSEREYLEHYFFLIALFGMSLAAPQKKMNSSKLD